MAPELFRLAVFVAVVDRNGYSAAARHLHLSQATVSHHVHELERTLDAELLRYERRAVHLTAAGREVYRSAAAILREQAHLEEALGDLRHGRRGRVRLGASMAFEQRYFFEQVVAPFRRTHDRVLLFLRFGHSPREAQAVLDHELDLAYVIRWQLPAGVHFERLHEAEMVFLVASSHPLAHKDTVTVDEIADVGLITAPLNSIESVYYTQLLRDCGLPDHQPVLEVEGMQARMLAAEAGLGVFGTFFPHYADDAVTGSLARLPVDGSMARVEFGLVSRPEDTPSRSVQDLADWLRHLAAD